VAAHLEKVGFSFFIINKSSLISHPIFSFPDQKQRRRTLGAQNGISKCTNQCVDDGCHSAPGRRQGATAISTFLQVRGQWPLRKFSQKIMNSLSITFNFLEKRVLLFDYDIGWQIIARPSQSEFFK